jgi:hypothetical protein
MDSLFLRLSGACLRCLVPQQLLCYQQIICFGNSKISFNSSGISSLALKFPVNSLFSRIRIEKIRNPRGFSRARKKIPCYFEAFRRRERARGPHSEAYGVEKREPSAEIPSEVEGSAVSLLSGISLVGQATYLTAWRSPSAAGSLVDGSKSGCAETRSCPQHRRSHSPGRCRVPA